MRAFLAALGCLACLAFAAACDRAPAPSPPDVGARPVAQHTTIAPAHVSVSHQNAVHNVHESTHVSAKTAASHTVSEHASTSVSVDVHNDTSQVVTTESHSASSHVEVSVHESHTEHVEQHVSNSSVSVHVEHGTNALEHLAAVPAEPVLPSDLASALHHLEHVPHG
jgi:hypothetical protein